MKIAFAQFVQQCTVENTPKPTTDGRLVLAFDGPAVLGCGALRPIRHKGLAKIGEIKRMYAREAGRGVGSSLLQALEERGRAFGYQTLWLETRRINKGAVKFYLKHGYKVRENYGPYIGRAEAVCFEKNL